MVVTPTPTPAGPGTTTPAVATASTTGTGVILIKVAMIYIFIKWQERVAGVRGPEIQHQLQLQPGHLLHQVQVGRQGGRECQQLSFENFKIQ